MSVKKPAARVKEKTSHVTEKAAASRKRPAESHDEAKETSPIMDARSKKDRREIDRRETSAPVAVERRGGERRAKVSRRRQIDPTTCERDYSVEEVEFMSALDEYKRRNGRMFPTCSEVLEVIRGLGYEKRTGMLTTVPAAENDSGRGNHDRSSGLEAKSSLAAALSSSPPRCLRGASVVSWPVR